MLSHMRILTCPGTGLAPEAPEGFHAIPGAHRMGLGVWTISRKAQGPGELA